MVGILVIILKNKQRRIEGAFSEKLMLPFCVSSESRLFSKLQLLFLVTNRYDLDGDVRDLDDGGETYPFRKCLCLHFRMISQLFFLINQIFIESHNSFAYQSCPDTVFVLDN